MRRSDTHTALVGVLCGGRVRIQLLYEMYGHTELYAYLKCSTEMVIKKSVSQFVQFREDGHKQITSCLPSDSRNESILSYAIRQE